MTRPPVHHRASEVAQLVSSWRAAGDRVALVPTMGALHKGHLALVQRAHEIADRVVVSIFVNPLQFGAGEDFNRYPRTLDDDLDTLSALPDTVVFAPEATEVYPDWPDTTPRFRAGIVGDRYEGLDRPGHFDGVLTVVDRLFEMVRCDVAVFGQKDAQQVFLVRELAHSRTPRVDIEVVATVRDADKLALSSRNRFLSEDDRASALALPRTLAHVVDFLATNPRHQLDEEVIEGVLADAVAGLESDTRHCHYLDVVTSDTFEPFRGQASNAQVVVIAACSVSGVRLLDAVAVAPGASPGH